MSSRWLNNDTTVDVDLSRCQTSNDVQGYVGGLNYQTTIQAESNNADLLKAAVVNTNDELVFTKKDNSLFPAVPLSQTGISGLYSDIGLHSSDDTVLQVKKHGESFVWNVFVRCLHVSIASRDYVKRTKSAFCSYLFLF